jgi:hypothetical protein
MEILAQNLNFTATLFSPYHRAHGYESKVSNLSRYVKKNRDYSLIPGEDVSARKRKVMEKFKLSETFLKKI